MIARIVSSLVRAVFIAQSVRALAKTTHRQKHSRTPIVWLSSTRIEVQKSQINSKLSSFSANKVLEFHSGPPRQRSHILIH